MVLNASRWQFKPLQLCFIAHGNICVATISSYHPILVVVVNERCEVDNGACGQTSVNTATSVPCSCIAGYELDSDDMSCNG